MGRDDNFIIGGKYKVIECIGEGGMGKVYKVQYGKLNIVAALKEINKKKIKNLDFMAEPNLLKELRHFHIPRIIDIEETDDYFYIIMDYIEGVDLRKELNLIGKFSEDKVVKWAKQLTSALEYLHSQNPPIIYRDMKPDNIMLDKNDDIYLIDFGISKKMDDLASKDKNMAMTKRFAAPEQLEFGYTDERSDIYSLGLTLFFLVTGKRPEKGMRYDNIRAIDKSLSQGLEYIIGKSTSVNPKDRYKTAKEMLLDIENIEKFSDAYKRQKAKKMIKSLGFAIALSLFVAMTFYGYKEMENEKRAAYEELIDSGRFFISSNEFDKAEESIKAAIEKDPKNHQAYVELANLYFSTGNFQKAIDYINIDAVNKLPSLMEDFEMRYILGNCYYYMKSYDQALSEFQYLTSMNPNNNVYNRDLAATLIKLNKVQEAEDLLLELKNKNIEEASILYIQGELNKIKNENTEAVDNFRKAIKKSKDDDLTKRMYITIAEIYRDNPEDFDNALNSEIEILEECQNAFKQDNSTVVLEMLGLAYYKNAMNNSSDQNLYNENINKSIDSFKKLVDRGYKVPYVYRNIGMMYQYINDFDNSEKYLLEAKELDKSDYKNYVQLALLYADIESNKPEAERDYSKVEENYNLALNYAPSGESSSELNQLKALVMSFQ